MAEEIALRQISSITFEKYIGCLHSESQNVIQNLTLVDKYQIKLMSHFCLNGSLSYLSQEDWGKYCHPYHEDHHKNFGGIYHYS